MNKESESESEILSILIEVLSRARAKRRKSIQDFKSGILIGRFSSDGASSMTMKGLILPFQKLSVLKILPSVESKCDYPAGLKAF